MRIIIETNDPGHVESSVSAPASSVQVETVDGGGPSEASVQAVTAEGDGMDGMDAGAPPQWLMEAIQGATQGAMQPGMEGADTDAGRAPSSDSE